MKTVTLRWPDAAYRRLVGVCRRDNVTMRGVFEATVIISIKDLEDPARRDNTLLLWEAVRALEVSEAFRARPTHRVNAKLDDDIADLFSRTCCRFSVSRNAALGLVAASPWPIPETPEYRELRHENWVRIVELARAREFARRPYVLA